MSYLCCRSFAQRSSFPLRSALRLQQQQQRPLHAQPREQLAPSTTKSNKTFTSLDGLTKITALPNGLRVATENTPGHFAALGMYIDAGSRYENPQENTTGCSHLLDRLAFKGTTNRTPEDITNEAQSLGGNIICSSSREAIMYQSAVFKEDLPRAFSLLADSVRRLHVRPEEMEEQRQTALYEINEICSKPEMILPELVHTTAFKNNTLGLPLLCDPDRLKVMQVDHIRRFLDKFFRPSRIVIAACGAKHEDVLKLAEREFGDWKAPEDTTSINPKSEGTETVEAKEPLRKCAKYTGGVLILSPESNPIPQDGPVLTSVLETVRRSTNQLAHLYVGFPGLPITDPDVYTLATIQTLLGGGGSFSAGGPGKGMYSRLYTQVLNQNHWIENCAAFNHTYTDGGLFGVSASCEPKYIQYLPSIIASELAALLCPFAEVPTTNILGQGEGPQKVIPVTSPTFEPLHVPSNPVTEADLSRARNQLRSALLMNLESRMVQLEDLGRQVQVYGKKIPIQEMCDRIDAVTLQDVQRVAERVLVNGPWSVVEQHRAQELADGPSSSGVLHRLGRVLADKAHDGFWKRKSEETKLSNEESVTSSMPIGAKLNGGGMTIVAHGTNMAEMGDVVETFAKFGIGWRSGYKGLKGDN